jgi:hypothetical protein
MDINPTINNEIFTPSLKYIICASIAGGAAKIYDDIEDNYRLAQLKTTHNMETLKGIHFIMFTIVSIAYPLFFISQYIFTWLTKMFTPSSFNNPYENSLFSSFAFLFLFLDYSKVIHMSTDEYVLIIIAILSAATEEAYDYVFKHINNHDENTVLLTEEVSFKKLGVRIIWIICLIVLYLICDLSGSLQCNMFYFITYGFISCCTQFYSLYIYKPPQPIEVPPIIQEKKEEKVGSPEIKEDTDLFASTSKPTI